MQPTHKAWCLCASLRLITPRRAGNPPAGTIAARLCLRRPRRRRRHRHRVQLTLQRLQAGQNAARGPRERSESQRGEPHARETERSSQRTTNAPLQCSLEVSAGATAAAGARQRQRQREGRRRRVQVEVRGRKGCVRWESAAGAERRVCARRRRGEEGGHGEGWAGQRGRQIHRSRARSDAAPRRATGACGHAVQEPFEL